jgi:hypothetical protein
MTPRAFLNLLWGAKPNEHYILLWTLQDKRSHWFQDVAEAADFASAAASSQDVYVGLALSQTDLGPMRRCKSEEASGICGIGSDLDLKSDAHGVKPLPATIPEALKILPAGMPPSILVLTGNGVHPWWLFKEPLIFDSEGERKDAARVLARWHALLGRNAANHEWSYDKLSDLARILRIPGTRNLKDSANPKAVTILSVNDRRYNLSDFEEFLDREGILDAKAQETAAQEWAEKFADKHLVIDLTKRIGQDRIDMWMRDDLRFRNTWLRQRHDLKDQSQSGYDLALACFGMDAGLSEQEIVTLIIHHRALYSRPQRTRVDYFQRTIGKATRKTGGGPDAIATLDPPPETPADDRVAAPPTTAPVPPGGAHVAPEQPEVTDNATEPMPEQREALCARIATILKTPILRFTKLDGKEPTYHMKLTDGRVIEFASFAKFTDQQSVHNAIGAVTNRHIPRFKPKAWAELSQWMLNACYIEEPTDEEDLIRGARLHLLSYLQETEFIASIENQRVQDQRKPIVTEDGRIAVSSIDFQAYMAKTTCQKVSQREAGSMLVAVGGTKYRVCGRKYDQIRRVLPLPDFDPREIRPQEAHDVQGE